MLERPDPEFFLNRLVIWVRKQRLIVLDARVRNKGGAEEYYKAAGGDKPNACSKIRHGCKRSEIFYRFLDQYTSGGGQNPNVDR